MMGTSRKGMVGVVSRFTHRQQGHRCEVRRSVIVIRSKGTIAPEMARRVDSKRAVLKEEHSEEPSPNEPSGGASQDPVIAHPMSIGRRERCNAKQGKQAAHDHEVSIARQIRCSLLFVGGLALEQPSNVRVERATSTCHRRRAVRIWGVRVAVPICVHVMSTMVCNPTVDGSFHR